MIARERFGKCYITHLPSNIPQRALVDLLWSSANAAVVGSALYAAIPPSFSTTEPSSLDERIQGALSQLLQEMITGVKTTAR